MSVEQLLAITQEAKQIATEEKDRPRVDCPICGEILDSNGTYINCPLGHWRARVGATQGSH